MAPTRRCRPHGSDVPEAVSCLGVGAAQEGRSDPSPRFPPRKLPRPASVELEYNPPSSGHPLELQYIFKRNDVIMKKYRVRSLLGRGSFGTVVAAVDSITDTAVAVKLLHKYDDLHEDMRHEEKIYRRLLAGCDPRIDLFAEVITSGIHRRFHCIAFELCAATLFDVVKGHMKLLPLPGRHILEIAYQLIKAVDYLHTVGIMHTDLKLDNVALQHQNTTTIQWFNPQCGFQDKTILVTTQICVLDLGGAILSSTPSRPGRVSTVSYRCPEVVLGLPWGFGVDVFAVGCIIAELYLGCRLLPDGVESDREHLAMLERVLGPFPRVYAHNVDTRFPGTFYIDDDVVKVQYPPADTVVTREDHRQPMRCLEDMKCLSANIHDSAFSDLLHKLMALNPAERISLDAAGRHNCFDSLRSPDWS